MKRAAILVVDDEPEIRELMKACLEIEGFVVITAANGREGLQRYKENKDQVRVIITDLDMPAMTGPDMIRKIFKITPAAKVIVASGRSGSYVESGEGPIGTASLQKPYSSRELTAAVRLLL